MIKFSDIRSAKIDWPKREITLYDYRGSVINVLVFASSSPIGRTCGLLRQLCHVELMTNRNL